MSGLFAAAKKEHWTTAGNWLFYAIALGALPFWGVVFIWWLFAASVPVGLFTDNAQLAVYSAGLLASAIPMMQREVKDSPFKHPRWFLGLSILVLVIGALVFTAVTLTAHANNLAHGHAPMFAMAGDRLLFVSIVLTAASLTLCFFTELIENIRQDINYGGVRASQVNALGAKVKKLMEGENGG